ncbi:F-type H+-transporting ATPase subunit b [Desulfomicrobium macestii]|uniref:ATP synthase subunit b n=2 Tax=Desulfomicrobium TaxID=898 RepID=A0A8G2C4E5_DESNO|nr:MULTISPECIES: ATP synthase F0 subunit B [Desulfomicrobium]MBE1424666.1 F-type H+-transporting ATPase subunit b [Desulfomicrobium macestii]SFL96379.1 F-type H+-transporting ATPase subunit b [Desulfomicrobium norvegicum]
MIDLDYTFFVQLVNFMVILTVLNLILYRPIRGIIKKRAEVMSQKLGSIEDFAAKAEAKLESYKVALSGARVEAQQMRVALKAEGVAVESSVLAEAGAEAAEKIAAARKEIDGQKQTALKALRQEVATYAKNVANKVLSKA